MIKLVYSPQQVKNSMKKMNLNYEIYYQFLIELEIY